MKLAHLVIALGAIVALPFLARASTTVEAVGRINGTNLSTGPWAGARVGEIVHMTYEVVDNGFIYDANFPNRARRFDVVPGTFKMTVRGARCDLRLTSTFDPTTDLTNDYPVSDAYIFRGAGDVVGLLAEETIAPLVYNLTFELHASSGTAWSSADMGQILGDYAPSAFDFVEWSVTGTNGTGFGVQLLSFIVRSPAQLTGGCCLGDGWCAVTSAGGCLSGNWTANAACASVTCLPAGACCLPNGSCTLLTQPECQAIPFATYQGDNTACGQTPCAPSGACCINNACSILTEAACLGNGGTWLGAGTSCSVQPQIETAPTVLLPDATGTTTVTPGVYSSTISVPAGSTLVNMEVWLDVQFGRVNDFVARLTGPNGTTVDLFRRITPASVGTCGFYVGAGYTMNGTYIFQDSATQSLTSYVSNLPTGSFAPGGRFRASGCAGTPVSLDAAFAGINVAGDWTLEIRDERTGIRGNLFAWALSFNGGNLPPCAACPADLDDDGDYLNGMNPDGGVDINDLIVFLGAFENGDISVDVDDDGINPPNPDGGVDINDLLFFLAHFEAGC